MSTSRYIPGYKYRSDWSSQWRRGTVGRACEIMQTHGALGVGNVNVRDTSQLETSDLLARSLHIVGEDVVEDLIEELHDYVRNVSIGCGAGEPPADVDAFVFRLEGKLEALLAIHRRSQQVVFERVCRVIEEPIADRIIEMSKRPDNDQTAPEASQ